MEKIFKQTLAIMLAVIMTVGAAPLAGFVGLDLPDISSWFAAEAEAARRFGVVHLHQGEDDFYLIANEQKDLYSMAGLYRR